MDDYRDQATWFEVQWLNGGRWETATDVDTDYEAEAIRAEYEELDPALKTRVRRVRGLA